MSYPFGSFNPHAQFPPYNRYTLLLRNGIYFRSPRYQRKSHETVTNGEARREKEGDVSSPVVAGEPRVRSPLTIFHLHTAAVGWGGEAGTGVEKCFPRPRAIHFRAAFSRGGIAIKRSVFPVASSPSPRYLRNLSRDHPLDDPHSLQPSVAWPTLRRRVRRAAFR